MRFIRLGWAALALPLSACAPGKGPAGAAPGQAPAIPATAASASAAPSTTAGKAGAARYIVGQPYQFDGTWYIPAVDYDYDMVGLASVYPPDTAGRPTTDGEIYDPAALTAAHKTLPLPTVAWVTDLDNGLTVKLRIDDRGPFVDGQIIQLSQGAAKLLGIKDHARVWVQVDAVESRRLAATLAAGEAPPAAAPAVVRAPAGEPHPAPGFYIQAGAFRDAANAARLRQRLAGLGQTKIVQIRKDGQDFACVRIGPLASRAAADRLLGRVTALGQKGAWIVAVPAG